METAETIETVEKAEEADSNGVFKVTFHIKEGGDVTLTVHEEAPEGADMTFLTPVKHFPDSKVVTCTQVAHKEDMLLLSPCSQPCTVGTKKQQGEAEVSSSQPNLGEKAKKKLSM